MEEQNVVNGQNDEERRRDRSRSPIQRLSPSSPNGSHRSSTPQAKEEEMQSAARVAAEHALRLTSPKSLLQPQNVNRRSPTPPATTSASSTLPASSVSNGLPAGLNPLAGGGPASIQAALAAMQGAASNGAQPSMQQLGLQMLLGAQQQQGGGNSNIQSMMGQNPLLAAMTLAAATQSPPASTASSGLPSPFAGGDLAQQAQMLQTMAQLQTLFMQANSNSQSGPPLLPQHGPAALMQSQVGPL